MAKDAKSFRKQLQKTGTFYTPEKAARYMASFFTGEVKEVYDPTCGDGNLLAVFGDEVKKYGQEIDAEQLGICKERLTNFEGYCGDTLKDPAWIDRKFDWIIANPPYSIAWEPFEDDRWKGPAKLAPKSKCDWNFVLHCLYMLSDMGIASVLVFPGILYRGNAEGVIREWFVKQNVIERVIQLDSSQYEFVDTNINTVLLVLSKHKTTTDVIFEDSLTGKSKVATLEEIEKEGYNLSVQTYIDFSEEKEPIDIVALNMEVEAMNLSNIYKEIKMEAFMHAFAPDEYTDTFSEYMDKVAEMVEKGRKEYDYFLEHFG